MNSRSPLFYTILCSLTALAMLLPDLARAQMFSVQERDPFNDEISVPQNYIYLGLEPVSFEYEGDVTAAQNQNAGIFAFENPIVRLRYRNLFGLEMFLGFGGSLTGLDNISYFDLGIELARGVTLTQSNNFIVRLPLQLKTSVTTVTTDLFLGTGTQFDLGTFSIGAGGELQARLNRRTRLLFQAVPNVGFSFSTGNTFGGSVFEVETRAQILFDRLFGNMGLAAGWDYGFRRYDVDENLFDYDLAAHSIIIGLTF